MRSARGGSGGSAWRQLLLEDITNAFANRSVQVPFCVPSGELHFIRHT